MRRVVAFIVVLAGLLVGCVPQPGPREVPGGAVEARRANEPKRLTAGILGDPYTLSQAINAGGTGSIRGVGEMEKMIHAGLSMLNGDGDWAPQLAEAVPSLDNGLWKLFSDGGMETTWVLKPGARWHDGSPFTSADLLFTARVVMDKELALSAHPSYEAIESIAEQDERTIVVKWKHPYIEAQRLFTYDAALPLPRHLLESAYTNDKPSFLQLPYWSAAFVGAGPFRVQEFVADSHLVLKANDGYVLGRPKVDEIIVRFISDPNTMIANLLAGDVDLTVGRGLNLEQALQVDAQWTSGKMDTSPSNWVAHYPQLLTPDPQVIGDVRFRRALLQAIDRKQMSDQLQAGRAPIAHSFLQVNDPLYRQVESSIVNYEFDPRAATQAIEALGFTRRGDGFFSDGSGQKLTVESRTNGGDDLKEKMLFASADYWQRIGVGVNTVVTPRQLASDREYRATNPGFDLVRQPFDPLRFSSKEVPLPDNKWKGKNRTRYVNPTLNALIDGYYATIPLFDRVQILRQMVHLLSDQVVALGVFYAPEPMLISDRLVNVASGKAAEVDETWNVQEWDLK
jgi:peptide/nickel transport system substrate-binding protein